MVNSRQLEAMYAGRIPWSAAEAFARRSALQAAEVEARRRRIESLRAESRLVLEHARAAIDGSWALLHKAGARVA